MPNAEPKRDEAHSETVVEQVGAVTVVKVGNRPVDPAIHIMLERGPRVPRPTEAEFDEAMAALFEIAFQP
jgi:hypothetical protein